MRLTFLIPALCLTACSLAPDAVVPTDRIPDGWRGGAADTSNAKPARWSDFGSKELDTLITTALANNTDIAAALARVEEARATARIQGSGQYPGVEASGSAGHTRTSSGGIHRTDDSSDATLAIAYELDLWQRNSNLSESALLQWRASQYDRDALTLLVSSEVARLYSGVLAFDARMGVARNNLKNAEDVLRITELRYKEGAISGLERAQQRTSVENTRAAIASLENQRNLFFNQLALVVGTAPSKLQLASGNSVDQLHIPKVPLNTPWQLLERRPDIAAAEARLRSANIDIGVARADALPSLSLGLNAGVTGSPSGTLVGLAASFFAPIFEGGALQGAIERSEAVRDEQVAAYRGVLLTAFREVEDALSNYETAVKRRDALSIAAAEARKADAISHAQFNAGSIDFTTLLNTQAALLQAEDSYYSAVQDQLTASVDLIRALGGTP
jgi:NodT family efflux transporter outer membrane factor (OMF) lipoprotein